MMHLDELAND